MSNVATYFFDILDKSNNPMTDWGENVELKHTRNAETLSGLNPNLCSLFKLNQTCDASKQNAEFRSYVPNVLVVFQTV